ncbi:glycosyltransferase family 2 protein [Paenibacillus pini]|nr:glycosyltransferase [Paenibacillus pini]
MTLKIIIVILICQLGFAIWNAAMLPKLGNYKYKHRISEDIKQSDPHSLPEGRPSVSVLIPARNEALNIEECLTSVLNSYSDVFFEVLVLDDRSTDETADIVRRVQASDSRVKLLEGKELPQGWIGKSHACYQLAQEAQGVWWLFFDADTRLAPDALSAAIKMANNQKSGLITGFPKQETGTWLERLVVPMMMFTIICHLPIFMVQRSNDPRFVAAHGAFMFIHRDSYMASGGHEGIKAGLVDDMALARAVKISGHPVTLADVHYHVSMRMYRNASEVWNGYRKNIYEGVGRSGFLLGGVLLLYTFLYLLPPICAVILCILGHGELALWAGAATLLGIAVKAVSDKSSGQPGWICLLLPGSIASLVAIAISSWKSGVSGKGYIWKGRRYG